MTLSDMEQKKCKRAVSHSFVKIFTKHLRLSSTLKYGTNKILHNNFCNITGIFLVYFFRNFSSETVIRKRRKKFSTRN